MRIYTRKITNISFWCTENRIEQVIQKIKVMAYKCPHCKSQGSSQRICHYCFTVFCTTCKTTVLGAEIVIQSINKCPICKNLNNVFIVDHSKQEKRTKFNKVSKVSE